MKWKPRQDTQLASHTGRSGNPRLVKCFVALVFVGFGLSACGSDTTTLKKADFLKRADAICSKARTEVDRLQDESNVDDADKVLEIVDKALETQVRAIQDVRDLGEPDADATAIRALLADAEAAFTAAKSASTEFEFNQASTRIKNLAPVADKLGFKVCGAR